MAAQTISPQALRLCTSLQLSHPHASSPTKLWHSRRSKVGVRLVVKAADILGDVGARDPFPAEIESNFGDKVLGNYGTDHVILIPKASALSLASKECIQVPKGHPPMSREEASALLNKLVGWRIAERSEGMRLQCVWKVRSFAAAIQLIARIAAVSESAGHHPDLHLEGGVSVRAQLWTPQIGGLSMNDFIVAAKIDQIKISDLTPKKRAIQRLYAKVLIQLKNFGTSESATLCSSIGVKQGCPLSPTLFGIFIDALETWMEEVPAEHGIIVGSLVLRLLLFADDVALISKTGKGLHNMLQVLDKFCIYSGLKVNVAKTKVMVCGTRTQIPTFYIGDKQVENVTIYKYLGVEFSSNYKWGECISQRVASGMKALYALRNKCKKEEILSWEIRRKLFRAIIQPVVLYGSVVWSPGLPEKWWKAIENVQKQFLIGEFKVKQQVQYDILLLEADLLPLEIEALYQFISYTQQLQNSLSIKFSKEVLHATQMSGWYHHGKLWLQKWGIQEEECMGDTKHLHQLVKRKALDKIWSNVEGKKKFYLEEVRGRLFHRPHYLFAAIPIHLRSQICRARMGSHYFRVETGRWLKIPRENRTCRLCSGNSIEDEQHVFLQCPYTDIHVEDGASQ